jgi:oligoendopeptidase F
MLMPLDLDSYAREAEQFVSALDREYYLHFAGHKETFEIEPIYDRHTSLFERAAVDQLREQLEMRTGDSRRRCQYLLQLAVEGLIGRATKAQAAALAERESALEIEFDGRRESYRQAVIVQSNEPDPDRRLEIERARLEALEADLNPFHLEILEQAHRLSAELGWPSYRAMYEELKEVDLVALERETHTFSDATAERYREIVEPQLLAETGIGLDSLRRSDLPYFFRAKTHDHMFPAARLMEAFERTLEGLGIDLEAQINVRLDLEQRTRKSPRAFCAPVRVPDEIYLVIPRRGGRDDYSALFHEGGHTEHFAWMDAALPFEFRHLGDNSVTEGFAFLFEHLVEDESWLEAALGADQAGAYMDYVRASKLIFLRRYAAKLDYELELHSGERPLAEMPALYAQRLGEAVGVAWPEVSYLSDVDEGFYCANYLRAWAFEASLRRLLRARFGAGWFGDREAGELLRSLWREGQRQRADELLNGLTGERLDFSMMISEVLPQSS